MGIQGLLPALMPIQKQRNISHYAGKKAAIDGYCWLHKAAYTCSAELAHGKGLDKLIQYCMARIELMKRQGVTPVMVFDGGHLGMKKKVEQERQGNREKSRKEAQEYAKAGDEKMALRKYSESVDITPKMAFSLIKALQMARIEYIVAPYEADAQLMYLWKEGIVQVVVTEDSDLLAFGCGRCFFKMD